MDTVYVIYFDNQMYKNKHRKNAYLEIGRAKQVVTCESKELAKKLAEEDKRDWYEMNEKLKEFYLANARDMFEIREFVEKK